ncbi:transcriptional regulator [Salmonella enterica subsp. enterica serovar Poona]|uniref:Transcriptional regulator n=1 Tax=Salmonella enterica TaxID=28901 RepID=A0A762BWI6_SALER|nr:PapB/FocB family fimbrial expression transcriptional regulator [Salmonella enterica]EBR0129401.1 transcriptional regulator [Salmonella enterica subsp. enterica serovar Ajiobo]EBV2696141.1 transcriptional regulator [Salmonella enterica subsp. enterica serovar Poona]EBW5539427.1 transcriptional regulator [Salmonella enterica subsp. enterica serovar Pasing]EIB9772985.1 transcriptional regulator [Salmonella enterica subsp. enterica serovar Limete]EBA1561076.1 transcriptional regulator [Salmonel
MIDDDSIYYSAGNAACVRKQMLVAGALTSEWFELLIEISPIHSSKVIKALRAHLVDGDSRKSVCERYGVNAGYMSICMGRLFHINQIVGKLALYYSDNK